MINVNGVIVRGLSIEEIRELRYKSEKEINSYILNNCIIKKPFKYVDAKTGQLILRAVREISAPLTLHKIVDDIAKVKDKSEIEEKTKELKEIQKQLLSIARNVVSIEDLMIGHIHKHLGIDVLKLMTLPFEEILRLYGITESVAGQELLGFKKENTLRRKESAVEPPDISNIPPSPKPEITKEMVDDYIKRREIEEIKATFNNDRKTKRI